MSYEGLICGNVSTTLPAWNVGTISILAPSGQTWENNDFSNASGSRMVAGALGLNDMQLLGNYVHYRDNIIFQPSGLLTQTSERFNKYSRRYR